MANEEWRDWIGKEGPVVYPPYEMSQRGIGYFIEMTENANPLYWNDEYAKKSEYEGIIAPRSMAFSLCIGPTWSPDPSVKTGIPAIVAMQIPLDTTNAINTSIASEYYAAVRPGDKVHYQSKVVDIKPRTTRLGTGFFITEDVTIWNQRNEKVAVLRNTLLRYKRETNA